MIVVDANVALSWVMPDEKTIEGSTRLGYAVRAAEVPCAVPSIWEYEVDNGLTRGIRQGRMSEEEGRAARRAIRRLPITVYGVGPIADRTWEIALTYGLTFYDASYLALAEELGCECVTDDQDMIRAAASSGLVRWVGDYE